MFLFADEIKPPRGPEARTARRENWLQASRCGSEFLLVARRLKPPGDADLSESFFSAARM